MKVIFENRRNKINKNKYQNFLSRENFKNLFDYLSVNHIELRSKK